MNEDKWAKLSKEDQAAIEKVSGEHLARMAGQSWDDADKRGMEGLQKSGVKIVNADAAFVAEVQKRIRDAKLPEKHAVRIAEGW
jgi:TRAP-type C4-dicarboxylate transport system substrate-binding protein